MNYGRYQTIKEVGRGSMGVVYQARDPQIDRVVAVKVLRHDRTVDEIFVKRFLKEAKVIGRLSHPHIVTIYDVGEEQGNVYIAMEFLEGGSLADLIGERRLTACEVVEFGIQIANTLDYAHKKGVVHRDIKPSNIIVQPDGQIRITDFGIARIEDSSATLLTQVGDIMGTPTYMSPEQVLGNPVDGRSDIFSLGVILYEMSTGQKPFGGGAKSLATIFDDIIKREPQEPCIVEALIPRELSELIMKALRKEPAHRFQTGHELAQALKESLVTNGQAVTATPSAPVQKRKLRFSILFGAGAVVSLIVGGTYCSSRNKSLSPTMAVTKPGNVPPAAQPTVSAPPPARERSVVVRKAKSPPVRPQKPRVKQSPANENNESLAPFLRIGRQPR